VKEEKISYPTQGCSACPVTVKKKRAPKVVCVPNGQKEKKKRDSQLDCLFEVSLWKRENAPLRLVCREERGKRVIFAKLIDDPMKN